MNLFVNLGVVAIFFFPLIAGRAGTPEKATVAEQPPGFHGVNPYVNVGVGQLLKHTNFIFAFGGDVEVTKGRFGALGGLLYLDAQAGVSGEGLVSRTGLGMQEFIGQMFASYRVVEGRVVGWICWRALELLMLINRPV
jgi:hypothetical protein